MPPMKEARPTNKRKKDSNPEGDAQDLMFPKRNPDRNRQSADSIKSEMDTNSIAFIINLVFCTAKVLFPNITYKSILSKINCYIC